jgi:hypothetical protein
METFKEKNNSFCEKKMESVINLHSPVPHVNVVCVVMCSYHDVHEMNAYRADYVCPHDSV